MEELRWQQNDTAHDASHDHTGSTSRRKMVSFCKSLSRIFDHTPTPYHEDNDSSETMELLEYKHRVLCFMNRLMQRYGKRAVECFLGTATVGSATSSRKSLNYVGYKLVASLCFLLSHLTSLPLTFSLSLLFAQTLPSVCRLCVSTIHSLEQVPQENPSRGSSHKRQLEVYLVHAVSKFFLNIEQSLQVEVCFRFLVDALDLTFPSLRQNSSLKRLIESSKSSELVSQPLPPTSHLLTSLLMLSRRRLA
jgi:hypothetical protein